MSAGSVREQFADTMLAVGPNDPNLVVLVGDISHGILQPYAAACPGRFYNVGTGTRTSLKELAEEIVAQTGTNQPIQYRERSELSSIADLFHLYCDEGDIVVLGIAVFDRIWEVDVGR